MSPESEHIGDFGLSKSSPVVSYEKQLPTVVEGLNTCRFCVQDCLGTIDVDQ